MNAKDPDILEPFTGRSAARKEIQLSSGKYVRGVRTAAELRYEIKISYKIKEFLSLLVGRDQERVNIKFL